MTNIFAGDRSYGANFYLKFQNDKYEQFFQNDQREKKVKFALSILGFNVAYSLFKFVQSDQGSEGDLFTEIIQIISLLSNFAAIHYYPKIENNRKITQNCLRLGGLFFWVKNLTQATSENASISALCIILHMSMTSFLLCEAFFQHLIPNLIQFAVSLLITVLYQLFSQTSLEISYFQLLLYVLIIYPVCLYGLASIEYQFRKKWVVIDTLQKTNKTLEKTIEEAPVPLLLVQQNLDIILQNICGLSFLAQFNHQEQQQNQKITSLTKVFPEDTHEKIKALVQKAIDGKKVKSRMMVSKTILEIEEFDIMVFPSQWKGKKIAQISFQRVEQNVKVLTKEIEKIKEVEVEKIVQTTVEKEIEIEVIKAPERNLSFSNTIFQHNIEPTISPVRKARIPPKSSDRQFSSDRKKKNKLFSQAQELQSPGLSAIKSDSSTNRNIEINLNVDQEIENKFDFLESAMAKALEQILYKIKQCKGKKLNIFVSNNKSNQKLNDDQQLEGTSSTISCKDTPKSALPRANSHAIHNMAENHMYQQFRTPGPTTRKLDRMKLDSNNKLMPYGPKTDQKYLQKLKKKSMNSNNDNDLIQEEERKDSEQQNGVFKKDRKVERSPIKKKSLFTIQSKENLQYNNIVEQEELIHRPSIEVQSPFRFEESEKKITESQFKSKKDHDSPDKSTKVSSTTSILKGNFLSRMRQEDNIQGGGFGNSSPQNEVHGSHQSINENMLKSAMEDKQFNDDQINQLVSFANDSEGQNDLQSSQEVKGNLLVKPQIGEFCDPPKIMCADSSGMVMMQFQYLKMEEYPNVKKVFKKNGEDALNEYKKALEENNELFHVIFLNDSLPKLSGLQVVEEIRNIEKEKNVKKTKIIGVVVDIERINRQEYMDKGLDDVIEKPLNRENVPFYLKQKIDELISGVEVKYDDYMEQQDQVQEGNEQQQNAPMPEILTMQQRKEKAIAEDKRKKEEELKKKQEQESQQQQQPMSQAEKLLLRMQQNQNQQQQQQVQSQQPQVQQKPQVQEKKEEKKTEEEVKENNQLQKEGYQDPPLLLCITDSYMTIQQFSHFPLEKPAKRIMQKKGEPALQLIKDKYLNEGKQLFSLIIIDNGIKDMDFTNLIKEIKNFERQNNTQKMVIAVIVQDIDKVNSEEILQIGASYVYEKPLNKTLLNQLLVDSELEVQQQNNGQSQQPQQQQQQQQGQLLGNFQEIHLMMCGSESAMMSMQFPHFPLQRKAKRNFDSTGAGVLKKFKQQFEENQNLYTCILIDEKMKDMQGIECIKQIREYESEKKIKPTYIVFLTNDTSNSEEIVEKGANLEIEKPLNKSVLSDLLEKAVQVIGLN